MTKCKNEDTNKTKGTTLKPVFFWHVLASSSPFPCPHQEANTAGPLLPDAET